MPELLLDVVLCGAAFLSMEFVAAIAHRHVYHGIGWRFHESHHTPRTGVFEKNDVFPAFFASLAMIVMALSLAVPALRLLLPLSVGVSMYGVVYFLVHDLLIHRRSRLLRPRFRFLRRVHAAHALHHRFGGEPFGLLYIPKSVRARLARSGREDVGA